MKKIILCFLVSASLVACTNQDSKKAETSEDKESGTFTSLDIKSAIVKQLNEAYLTGDSSINSPLVRKYYADTVKVFLHGANNQVNGKTNEAQGGHEGFYSILSGHHSLYANINMTHDNIKTLVFNDGREVTLVWTLWSGDGKFTKEATTVPVHQAFYWSGDKIVSFHMIYDPTPLNKEIAAAQKK
jgi:hypothetical protein